MKKSQLKTIIRECIEEIALDEKTPNQKRSGRKSYDVRVTAGAGSMTFPVRNNTVYDDERNVSHIMDPDGMKRFKPKSSFKKSGVGK